MTDHIAALQAPGPVQVEHALVNGRVYHLVCSTTPFTTTWWAECGGSIAATGAVTREQLLGLLQATWDLNQPNPKPAPP